MCARWLFDLAWPTWLTKYLLGGFDCMHIFIMLMIAITIALGSSQLAVGD
jgi:hypothetical protein